MEVDMTGSAANASSSFQIDDRFHDGDGPNHPSFDRDLRPYVQPAPSIARGVAPVDGAVDGDEGTFD